MTIMPPEKRGDLLPVARTGSAEGSRQGEGKQVGRARGRFLAPCGRPCGTYWPPSSADTCPLRYISAVEGLLYQI